MIRRHATWIAHVAQPSYRALSYFGEVFTVANDTLLRTLHAVRLPTRMLIPLRLSAWESRPAFTPDRYVKEHRYKKSAMFGGGVAGAGGSVAATALTFSYSPEISF